MASASADLNIGPGDITRQVNQFLNGATGSSSVSHESLASSALFLLRAVPVARDAVLEHYAMAFNSTINVHLAKQESWGGVKKDTESVHMSALQDVTGVLLSFIKSNPEAWAPVVSSWALSLLGQISVQYANKQGHQHISSLNEVLQMWMACPPSQMLIEITTECFAAMVGGAPDICVDALLEASVRYSPHFDWVVAHIGSCFPRTIITRVLNCGFKDFCGTDKGSDKEPMASHNSVPKMASVVGILGHLASKHSQDIRKALMSLFESSLKADNKSNQVTLLPFLLQLASMSEMLHDILTTDLVSALSPPVLNQLHRQFTRWKVHSPSDYNSFLKLVVHLICKSKSGAFSIMDFILTTASPQGSTLKGELPLEEVRETCMEIVHILLFELQRGVLSRKPEGANSDIPLLTGLGTKVTELTTLLLSSEGKRVTWMEKLLTFTALQSGETCAANILTNVLFQATTPQQLGVFYRLKRGMEIGMPGIVETTLVQVFSRLESPATSGQSGEQAGESQSGVVLTVLKNLERIVIVENSKIKRKLIKKSPIIQCLRERHQILAELLLSPHPAITLRALTLVDMAGFPEDLSLTLLSQLCGTLTVTFFSSLHQRSQMNADMKCSRLTQLCMSCIDKLCQLPCTRSLLLHYLVEGIVQKEHLSLFGGCSSPATTSVMSIPSVSSLTSDPISLIEENRQQSLSIARPRFHSSVYHGGIIRQAGRKQRVLSPLSKDVVSGNCLTLIEMLWLCCREETKSWALPVKPWGAPAVGGGGEDAMDTDERIKPPVPTPTTKFVISESGARTLGCAVVEILTLDSLYNDVHWQEPDFRRVTTERDTLVWKRVEERPVFLSIIQEFSASCVFQYYVSPVLRSLTAVVMSHLEVSRAPLMSDCGRHHAVATQIVTCLAKGSLIIPPLSNVAELFPFVTPYEGYLLLLALWRYIKENPPSDMESEVLKRTCDNSHTSVVHSIIHANVDHMGQLCSRIFSM